MEAQAFLGSSIRTLIKPILDDAYRFSHKTYLMSLASHHEQWCFACSECPKSQTWSFCSILQGSFVFNSDNERVRLYTARLG